MARERRDYGGVVTKTIMLAFNRQIDQLRRRAINQHGISMLSPPSLGLARLLPRIGNAQLSERMPDRPIAALKSDEPGALSKFNDAGERQAMDGRHSQFRGFAEMQ